MTQVSQHLVRPTNGAIAERMTTSRSVLPVPVYVGVVVAVLFAMLSSNPLLTAGSIIALLLITRLLWRPGEPPVLLFAAGYQWIQVVMLVFIADYERVSVFSRSFSPQIDKAIWLGLLGLVVLSAGIRLGVRSLPLPRRPAIEWEMSILSLDRLFGLYLLSAAFAAVAPYIAWRVLPLREPLLILGSVKWVFYYILAYVTMRRRQKITYFVIASILEVLAGIGFFAEFKTVFFVAALAFLSDHVRLTLRATLVTAVAASAILVAGLVWMSVREDYRNILNEGTGQQVVLVSPVEQVTAFGDLVSDVNVRSLDGSVEQLLERIAYVDYFAAVINYVPRVHPHENGGLLLKAILHVLIPRFLYPDKAALNSDSQITMTYTGLTIPSSAEGTSIGVGYMAEMYVDFGPYGMFVPIILFGMLWGLFYAWLVSHASLKLTGLAFGTALMINAGQFEIAQAKLLGGMLARFVIFALLLRYAMPYLQNWLTRGSSGTAHGHNRQQSAVGLRSARPG